MSQVIIKDKKKRTGLRPLVGLILGAACLLIGFFAAPLLIDWLKSQNGAFGRGIEPDTLRLLIAGLIFLVLITLAGLIVGAATPKKAMNVKETDLAKEREDMLRTKEYEKKRQQKLNRQMRTEVRARTDSRDVSDDRRS